MQKSVSVLVAMLVLSGCATQDFVRESVAPVQNDVKALQTRAQGQEAGLKALDGRIGGVEQRVNALQQEAAARAAAAGKGEGKFLMSTVLTDDKVKFAHGKAQLTQEGAAELDQLMAALKSQDQVVFVEIQGHTDATGSDAVNQRLGQERAEAVRQYLARAGMPVPRMSTISYGESAPIADNKSAEGRSRNRRVHLVVLK
jgi:outer membrane protein OmpA-like peptidoglycan-associated protein